MADDKIIDEFQNNGPTECALESANDDQGLTKGQVVHRFVNNFHIHQGGQIVKYGNCGADKTCPRCEPVVGKHQCEICGMLTSATHGSIAKHQRVHTGERPFQCNLCQQSFKQENHLSQHQRIHLREFPYICDTCGDSFRQQTNLNNHQRSLHSEERAFECTECSKAFKLRATLTRHYRLVHNCAYSCPECGEKFRTRNAYTDHSVKHVKEKNQENGG